MKWVWNLHWKFQSRKFFDTIMPTLSWASIGNEFKVSGQPDSVQEDKKLGAQDKFCKERSIFNLNEYNSMNHQMGLKLALDVSKQEVLWCQLDSLMPTIHWKQSELDSEGSREHRTNSRKQKNTFDIYLLFRRTKKRRQIFNIAIDFEVNCCPSVLRPGGRPSQKTIVQTSLIAPILERKIQVNVEELIVLHS
jgi:hypothetical protein